ncbi:MAG: 3'(2'),5'-bisphosphate nucleotidase CysQ [Cyclobacteriaceae bacterium]
MIPANLSVEAGSRDHLEFNYMNLQSLSQIAQKAAQKASAEILNIYESGDFSIESKADNSPLTLADKASHKAIVEELEQTNIPILSEEGKEIQYQERKDWEYFWMIDPLDGTKEFIKRNGEFTVNIALINENRPILGVVYTPVLEDLFTAIKGEGATKNGKNISVNKFSKSDRGLKVVASRSHLNDETQSFLDELNSPEIVSKGSSLKLLMVAEGVADLYPRYAPTMEWDTAAAQIVVEEAGGKVLIKDSDDPVIYNKQNLLNPYFLVVGELVG